MRNEPRSLLLGGPGPVKIAVLSLFAGAATESSRQCKREAHYQESTQSEHRWTSVEHGQARRAGNRSSV